MRILCLALWALAIFILTCTYSFNDLLSSGVIQFKLDATPDLSELFSPLPAQLSSHFLQQKIGHFLAFFIFGLLLITLFASGKSILFLAAMFATSTEILQLFFHRDGRLFDIGIDICGILLALGIRRLYLATKTNQIDA